MVPHSPLENGTGMLIAQTAAGVARDVDGHYELLDVGGATLDELIRNDRLDLAGSAPVRGEVGRDETRTLCPVTAPGKFLIVGLNYSDHAVEVGRALPESPRFSFAPGSAVTGPYDDIVLPVIAPDEVDFECELAVVIGRRAVHVPPESAWAHVAGVTAANDVSARDIQHGRGVGPSGANVGLGKGFDTFKPLGPALLSADSLDPAEPLAITTFVDDELRQSSNTKNLIFGLPELVSVISTYTTLHPGDVILTGTPGGTGSATGDYLRPGQVVRVLVERIGELRNRVRAA